jgi:hypothetical protein
MPDGVYLWNSMGGEDIPARVFEPGQILLPPTGDLAFRLKIPCPFPNIQIRTEAHQAILHVITQKGQEVPFGAVNISHSNDVIPGVPKSNHLIRVPVRLLSSMLWGAVRFISASGRIHLFSQKDPLLFGVGAQEKYKTGAGFLWSVCSIPDLMCFSRSISKKTARILKVFLDGADPQGICSIYPESTDSESTDIVVQLPECWLRLSSKPVETSPVSAMEWSDSKVIGRAQLGSLLREGVWYDQHPSLAAVFGRFLRVFTADRVHFSTAASGLRIQSVEDGFWDRTFAVLTWNS